MVKVAVDQQDESKLKSVKLTPPSSDDKPYEVSRCQILAPSSASIKAVTDFVLLYYESATVAGGIKTGSYGLGLALAASFAAHRFHVPAYRAMTPALKAFAVTSVTTAAFIIGADSAARKYELSKYQAGSGTALEKESHKSLALEKAAGIGGGVLLGEQHREMSTRDMLVEWGKSHRYSVVFGAWGASMVGSFGYISMTPLSFAQKLVQARMVAQGLTVVVLIASAGLSAIPTGPNGQSDDQIKRDERENTMYAWKKNSPHAQHVVASNDKPSA